MGNKLSYQGAKQAAYQLAVHNRLSFVDVLHQTQPSLLKTTSGVKFSVLSYNILANIYTYIFWMRVSNKHLTFKHRSNIIVAELEKLSSDIICLQEVDNYGKFYKEKLEDLGYELMYAPRDSFAGDYCVLGAKKDVFSITDSRVIHFNEGHEFEKHPEFSKGNVAILAKLKHKPSGRDINVICAHLYWSFNYEHVRYLQAAQLIKHTNEYFKENDIVVLAGDLNALPSSNTLKYLLKGLPPDFQNHETKSLQTFDKIQQIYETVAHMPRKIELGSAYKYYGKSLEDSSRSHPDYTNYTSDFKGTIDYILYSKSTLIPRRLLKLPQNGDITEKSLPNGQYPSDHLPIMSEFEII